MPNIRPISDLRNHFPEIESLVNEGAPVYLTKNGRESMVIMNNSAYDDLVDRCNDKPRWTSEERAEINTIIAEIEESKNNGTYVTHDGFNEHMDKIIKNLENHAAI